MFTQLPRVATAWLVVADPGPAPASLGRSRCRAANCRQCSPDVAPTGAPSQRTGLLPISLGLGTRQPASGRRLPRRRSNACCCVMPHPRHTAAPNHSRESTAGAGEAPVPIELDLTAAAKGKARSLGMRPFVDSSSSQIGMPCYAWAAFPSLPPQTHGIYSIPIPVDDTVDNAVSDRLTLTAWEGATAEALGRRSGPASRPADR